MIDRADPFRALVDHSPFGILTVDSHLRIRHVSAGARPAFRHVQPLIGRHVAEALRIAWPEPFATEAAAIFQRTLETGEPYVSPGLTEKRQDLDSVESYEWQTSRLTLPGGGYGVVCYFFDTTRLHQAHAAVSESEERFRDFTSATSDVVYRMSPDWTEMRFLQGNEFIADTLEPSRTWLATYIPSQDQAVVTAAIERAIRSKRKFELEHRVIRSDGTIGWTFSRAIPILDDEGEIVEWFGAASDVTSRKEAETALSRSEERYRTLFDSIDEGFCIIDMIYDDSGEAVDYRFVEINPAFAKHTGLADAQGKTVRELVPNHERLWFRIYGEVAATGEPVRFENRGEGMHRCFDVYAFRLGGNGSHRVAALFTDITQRKLAEAAVDRARKYAEATLRTSPVPLLVLERDLRVVTANEAFYEHFQVTADRTEGRLLHELGDGQWNIPGLQELLLRILPTHSAFNDFEVTHEFEGIGLRTMLLNARRMEVEEGGPERIVLVIDDISERKAAEDALRDSEARHAFLLSLSDALRPLVHPVDIEATAARLLGEHLGVDRAYYIELPDATGIAHVNAEYLSGDSPSLVGQHRVADFGWVIPLLRRGDMLVIPDVAHSPLIPAADQPAMAAIGVAAHVSAPLVKGGALVGAFCVTEASPREWSATDVELVRESAERIWAAVERARAEQDRQRAEAALREADRRKDEFLAMLAHELRNPLAPIRTGLELIRLAGDNAASVARVRTTMERQVGHMVRLIDDLLDVSRITSGKIQLQRKPTALADLVSSAIDANRAAFDAAAVNLSVGIPDDPCTLDVDPTRMVQVLSNLLHNAGKFTSAGGHITISAECRFPNGDGAGGQLELRVSDDGVGISPEMLPRVFDLFTQGEHTDGRTQPGLGIGLALAKRLVEMHGGHIEAASGGLGYGSVFTIRMPIARHVVASDLPDAAAAVQTVTRRVVVIDDNEDAAQMMAMLVEALGGEARVAHDGSAGLREVGEFRPDVVLLDIGMPGMDGYDICRHIRRGPQGEDVFIVALTGWGQEQDKRRALEAGFDAHLTKPADPIVLERILADPHSQRSSFRSPTTDGMRYTPRR